VPYRYLDDIAIADAAFEVWAGTLEDLFVEAADATMNVMVQDLGTIGVAEHRQLRVAADALDLLLLALLEELIYLKDAERLLVRITRVDIDEDASGLHLEADAWGETINPEKHPLLVDVKAVTLHRLAVQPTDQGWWATVVVDV
jgi:SHS2 domain-containing protein